MAETADEIRGYSDQTMSWAYDNTDGRAILQAIDALRLELRAAAADLTDTLDERAALANGTRVVVLEDEDDDEHLEGHCGGYFCEVHNLHISCSHPDYDLLVDEHEALHERESVERAEEQDATAADHVMAATELRQYLNTVERALQSPDFAAGQATKRLIGVVRAGITAGAAQPMRDALVGIGSDQ